MFYMQMASNRRLWWTHDKCFFLNFTICIFVTFAMVKCIKDGRIINVNIHLSNAQKKFDILWNNVGKHGPTDRKKYFILS